MKTNPAKQSAARFEWEKFSEYLGVFKDEELPMVTVVIPTENSAPKISTTLDSMIWQNYPNLEVLVIDAGSIDRTLDVVKGYRDDRIKLLSVSTYNRYEMLNKGISHAKGVYINFMFPGDFYIDRNTLRYMMTIALENEKPELVYCGTLLRDGLAEPKILYRELSLDLLKKGNQPTSLQSCFFLKEVFGKTGKFNTDYQLRGGFDLMCRFVLLKELKFVSANRILTDYNLLSVTKNMVYNHFIESGKTIYRYFGLMSFLKWLKSQKDLKRLFRMWTKRVKVAITGS